MKLYHGTSEHVARKALLLEGLRPRQDTGSKGNWQHTVDSDESLVYLTTAYAGYFASMATEDGERWAVVEVDTDLMDENRLVPDEDWLEQASRGQRHELANTFDAPELLGSMKERNEWFRDHVRMFSDNWEKSVTGLGNCAHVGPIPPEAITRVGLFRPSDNPPMSCGMDPMIMLMNYKLMGDRYRACTRWLVGETISMAEFYGELQWPGIQRMVPGLIGFEGHIAEVAELLSSHAGLEVIKPQKKLASAVDFA